MKKIVYLTSVLVVLCTGKLSYDAAQNAQAVSQVQQQLQRWLQHQLVPRWSPQKAEKP